MPFTLSRARRVAAAASITGLASVLVVAPAYADLDCDGLAADAYDYQEELFCASLAASGDQVITLTASFAIPTDLRIEYSGTQPLTVQGAAGTTVVVSSTRGEGDADFLDGLFLVNDAAGEMPGAELLEVEDEESSEPVAGPDITISNVTVTGFNQWSAVVSTTPGTLTIADSSFELNAFNPEAGFFLPLAGGINAGGPLAIYNSDFTANDGYLGGAVSNWLADFAEGPEDLPETPASITGSSSFVGNTAFAGGAALLYGDITIDGATFDANAAEFGGAVIAVGSDVMVSDSSFSGNEASELGGALLADGSVTVESSDFTENASREGGAIASGGEGILDTATTITDSTFEANDASSYGAAVLVDGGSTIVERSTFTSHETEDGVGTVEVYGDLTVTDSLFEGNTQEYSSTVVVAGNATVKGTTFAGNSTEGGPAALWALSIDEEEEEPVEGPTVVVLENSTFFDNTTQDPGFGAVNVESGPDSEFVAIHNTFAGNTAVNGAVAHLVVDEDTQSAVSANVFTEAGDGDGCSIDGYLNTWVNFDQDGTCTADWSDDNDFGNGLDPMLGDLADNGGPTPTMLPLDGSPLLDKVNEAIRPTDQRGVERPQGDAADIGSVEIVVIPTGGPVEFQVKTDGGTIYGTATPAIGVDGISWITPGSLPSTPPAGLALPYGAAAFTVEVPTAGASVTITLTAPTPFTSVYKVTGTDWSEITDVTFSDDRMTVTYTLVDGGALDEDGEANGMIVDPVALAVEATFTG